MARPQFKQYATVGIACAIAGIFAAVVWIGSGARTTLPKAHSSEPVDAGELAEAVPNFSLTERSGKRISLRDLRGKVWVVDFIFTRCPGPCPAMSRKFAQLQRAFRKLDDVRLVSITVDPEHDTPEVLSKYADSYGADPERWLFLTGEKQTIVDLAVEGFKISAGNDPGLHGTHFVLVDRQGRIHGFYRSSDAEALEQLRRDVRELVKEPAG